MSNNAARRHYKLLDVILEVIYNNGANQFYATDLNVKVERIIFPEHETSEGSLVAVIDPSFTNNNAIQYLKSEGYIIELAPNLRLNYKGIIKLHEGGFESDYDRALQMRRREDSTFYKTMDNFTSTSIFHLGTLVFAFLGFLMSIIALCVK